MPGLQSSARTARRDHRQVAPGGQRYRRRGSPRDHYTSVLFTADVPPETVKQVAQALPDLKASGELTTGTACSGGSARRARAHATSLAITREQDKGGPLPIASPCHGPKKSSQGIMGVSAVEMLGAWDAVETTDRIRKKDVSAREVLEAAIARAEEVQDLGAVFERTYDRAHERGAQTSADAPLAGVPTFIKDMIQVRGVRTTWGSRATGRYVSRRTDAIAARMEESGLVMLGKSACPEVGLSVTTEPLGWPPCRNPHDPSRSPGGSSGGAAALVAAGVVPIAHGTDAGGSIRIPAACCGLVGLKPSRFRLDGAGSNLLAVNVVCEGVVTRTVRDTIAFYSALESRRPPRRVPRIGVRSDKVSPLRIGLFVDSPGGSMVDTEVQQTVREAARLCAGLGHAVEEIPCPFSGSLIDDFMRYMAIVAWFGVRLAPLFLRFGFDASKLDPWTRGFVEFFANAKLAGLAATMRLRRFARTYQDVMTRFDVLMSPTTPEPAPPLGHLAPDVPFTTLFGRMCAFAAFTAPYNVAGAPALSLPMGRNSSGLPLGVQFAAAHGRDAMLLDLATSLETARSWEATAPRQKWLPTAS
jgi:amidase